MTGAMETGAMENGDGFALEMAGVSKRFGRTVVLDDVSFRVRRGSVHGLVGHNGAGKSTLMKIALGGVAPTAGAVSVGGVRLTFSRPAEAREAGVGMVLQELSLIPTLSVADNIFLNAEQVGRLGTIAGRRQRLQARQLLHELGITSIRPTRMVGELGIAEQQMVEIAKAVRLSRKLLILDEPTAPLAHKEVVRLFELVRRTAALGIGVAGLASSGRSVLLKTLFGEIRPERGSVRLKGAGYRPRGAADAIAGGVYLIPEDRRRHGLVLSHTIEQNVVLSILRRVSRWRLYRPRTARDAARRMAEGLDLRSTGTQQQVQELSGGNQQKVVLAKALVAEPSVFLLDEPTSGVDVHTAAEIIRRMRDEANSGKAVLWVSSDLAELLTVSDRILVLAAGAIRAVVPRGAADFTEEGILRAVQPAGVQQ